MINFINDYSVNAHPSVIEELAKTNFKVNPGYSNDEYAKRLTQTIRDLIDCQDAEVQCFSGGTQTNLIAAATFLRPHEAIIAVKSGHICVHETGAIEGTGHKCIEVEGKDGKVTCEDIDLACAPQYWAHGGILKVKPKMVFISQTTEVGTFYTASELSSLRAKCDEYDLLLYCDGARLASGLDCSDVDLPTLAKNCDAFYIGGTKNGALFGEVMVIMNKNLQTEFRYIAKQKGGMLAKGWLLSMQFEVLFRENLYQELGKHANKMAMILKKGLLENGLKYTYDSYSNQQFFIFEKTLLEKLQKEFGFSTTSKIDENHYEARLVTSWETKEEDVKTFVRRLSELRTEL